MRDLLKHTANQSKLMVAATAALAMMAGLGFTVALPAVVSAQDNSLTNLSDPGSSAADGLNAATAAPDTGTSSSSSSSSSNSTTKSTTSSSNVADPTEENKNVTEAIAQADQAVNDCPAGACIINGYVNPAIKAAAGLAGAFAALGIVIGGIQYAMSGDEPAKVNAAKDRITKAVMVLLAFFLLFAFLSYLVPGGI